MSALVEAHPTAASQASYSAASGSDALLPDRYSSGDHDGRQNERVEPEFAALPPCERPFAAERTIWPAVHELAPTLAGLDAADVDLAVFEDEQPDLDEIRKASSAPVDRADDPADRLQLALLTSKGRRIALTAAILVVLAAAAGAVTLAVQPGRTSLSARTDQPSATAARSVSAASPVSAAASVASVGQSQLVVEPAAAAAPKEAAVVALLDRYFDAVNDHEFAAYKRVFILALRPGLSRASFTASLATTTDSAEQLHSISVISGTSAEASVTFVSRQPTVGRRQHSTCTAGTMEFYLGWRGTRYLLVAAPLWHEASSSACY